MEGYRSSINSVWGATGHLLVDSFHARDSATQILLGRSSMVGSPLPYVGYELSCESADLLTVPPDRWISPLLHLS